MYKLYTSVTETETMFLMSTKFVELNQSLSMTMTYLHDASISAVEESKVTFKTMAVEEGMVA